VSSQTPILTGARVGRPSGLLYPALVLGGGLFTALLAYHGFAQVLDALAVAGWGLLWVALFHLIPVFADAHFFLGKRKWVK
jgi:hypothetical protein